MYRYVMQILLVSWGLCLSFSGITANLTPIEVQIQKSILKKQHDELGFLARLVNINSGTENIKGVMKVGLLMEKQFRALGFKTRWEKEPASMHKAPTLIATRTGKQGKRVLLIAHLDTVFSPKSAFKKFKRQGNYAMGPGVSDDKGGDVVILYALKALAEQHLLDNTSITVVLTGDEEESGKPGLLARKPLIDAAKDKDVALDFEPSSDLNTISIGRRGITNWVLTAHGKEGHSSTIFKQGSGAGAIFEMARILNGMRTELGQQKNLSFSPGLILGGTTARYKPAEAAGDAFGKENVIAQTAIAQGDLRYLSSEQKQAAKEQIQQIINQHLPETSASIAYVDGIPAMSPTPDNRTLLEQYSQLSVDLGYGPVGEFDAALRGAGDISWIADKVPANLVGLGPVGEGQHSVSEKMDIHSLEMNTVRAALLLYRLTR